jgi:ribonucleotide monophosphatase NagD (HAD superfamily)
VPLYVTVCLSHRLRANGIPFKLCSNESTATRTKFVQKLNNHGMNICEDDVICPAPVLADILKRDGLKPHLLVHPGNAQPM